jgi:hypothetical protein
LAAPTISRSVKYIFYKFQIPDVVGAANTRAQAAHQQRRLDGKKIPEALFLPVNLKNLLVK